MSNYVFIGYSTEKQSPSDVKLIEPNINIPKKVIVRIGIAHPKRQPVPRINGLDFNFSRAGFFGKTFVL